MNFITHAPVAMGGQEAGASAYLTDGAIEVIAVDEAGPYAKTPYGTNLAGQSDFGIGLWFVVLVVSTVILALYLLLKRRTPVLSLPSYVTGKQ
jgi:hypothetical protein